MSSELRLLQAQMRSCRRCLEAGYAISPGPVFSGPITAEIMIVGQAPGVTEVEARRPFNGPSGRRLFEWLEEAGWSEDRFRATQYISAVTKCYPGKSPGGKGDRVPSRQEQHLCAPYLERELRLVDPKLLLPVGGVAVHRLLGVKRLSEVVGEVRQGQGGRWIVPLPHPSGASLWLNRSDNRRQVAQAIAHVRRLCQELEISSDDGKP